MLIRATRQVCFVMLRNGLTLELVYAPALTGRLSRWGTQHEDGTPEPSHGVWLLGERVLREVQAGQA